MCAIKHHPYLVAKRRGYDRQRSVRSQRAIPPPHSASSLTKCYVRNAHGHLHLLPTSTSQCMRPPWSRSFQTSAMAASGCAPTTTRHPFKPLCCLYSSRTNTGALPAICTVFTVNPQTSAMVASEWYMRTSLHASLPLPTMLQPGGTVHSPTDLGAVPQHV